MVKRRIAAWLIVCLVLSMTYQLQAGLYEDGLKAYKNGNYKAALPLFLKAAEQGNAKAQINLGVMYIDGQGVPQDYAKAHKWFRKAAAQGLAEAQYNLGLMYYNGQGVPQDYAEALKWYRKATEQGNAEAQSSLGLMYYDGQGGFLAADVEAYKWLNLAVSHLSPGVQLYLAVTARDIVASRMTPAQIAEAERRTREWRPKRMVDQVPQPP